MEPNIYNDGKYLQNNPTWHLEDSPWKAEQIIKILEKNKILPQSMAEVGCGVGGILKELSKNELLATCRFEGYETSPQAFEQAKNLERENIKYYCEDFFDDSNKKPKDFWDVLLVIDVFEHVEGYMSFLGKCRTASKYKIYHIPLDIHVSSVIRNRFDNIRETLGHIHYFTADSAISTLKDTGHEIIDFFYTASALELFKLHPSPKTLVANFPRWVGSKINLPLTARLFGGYSLLVLTQ
jgi:SAM-dependent methyltransferase